MATLIFIHGFPFAEARNGLGRRTQLMLRVLEGRPDFEERILASPQESRHVEDALAKRGWARLFTTTYLDWKVELNTLKPLYFARRLLVSIGLRFSRRLQNSALTTFGYADLRPSRDLISLIHSKPGATVWLARADLLHLIPYLRADQSVILDSNDSVANLVRCYDQRRNLRRWGFLSHQRLIGLLAQAELRLARRCNVILVISEMDRQFFSQCDGPKVILEESCVATPERLPNQVARCYDVGFLGGCHDGAVSAAINLIDLARSPLVSHCRFAVAGEVCTRLAPDVPPNVSLVGRVADSDMFFRSCRQILFWSNPETGTSVKFQEALLSGATVLSNDNGARWSAAKPGIDFFLCKTLEDALQHIVNNSTIRNSNIRGIAQFQSIAQRVFDEISI